MRRPSVEKEKKSGQDHGWKEPAGPILVSYLGSLFLRGFFDETAGPTPETHAIWTGSILVFSQILDSGCVAWFASYCLRFPETSG